MNLAIDVVLHAGRSAVDVALYTLLPMLALGLLCFVAFVTTVKPTAISAIQAPPDYCRRDFSGMRGCDLHSSQQCRAPSGGRGNLGPPSLAAETLQRLEVPEAARTTRE